MKFALNGALTMGTLDGANIEMMEEVGKDNIYIFGLTAPEITALKGQNAYHPWEYYQRHPEIHRVMDSLRDGRFDLGDHGIFGSVFDWILHLGDHFLHLADFCSYVETQNLAGREYRDTNLWTWKAILNVARMGKFSSDRCIREYAKEIWGLSEPAP